jgi:predicted 2-oxoglutarate/Fe(II)-dependent dioxygenase YbiX
MIGDNVDCGPGRPLKIPAFMPRDYCQELCVAAQAGRAAPAGVVKGRRTRQDERLRKTSTVEVPDHLIDAFVEKLEGIREPLASKFAVRLGGLESPQVLSYGRGGHFSVHQDTGDETFPSYVRNRALSVVLFLNSPSAGVRDGAYGGGTLTFFNILPGTTAHDCRTPVVGEIGTLVAFPSYWHHCVTPVQHGTRWILVTWITGVRSKAPSLAPGCS